MPKRVTRSAEAWTHVLKADRHLPVLEQSRFRLRPLTQAEKLAVFDSLNWVQVNGDGTQELVPRAFVQARELVVSHLEETENFPNDGPIPWPARGSIAEKQAYLEMLDEMDLLELGNQIRYQAQPQLPAPATDTQGEASAGVTVPNS